MWIRCVMYVVAEHRCGSCVYCVKEQHRCEWYELVSESRSGVGQVCISQCLVLDGLELALDHSLCPLPHHHTCHTWCL